MRVVVLVICLIIMLSAGTQVAAQYEICAYLAGWGDWRAEDIQGDKLTQLNYAFAVISNGRAVFARQYDIDNMALLAAIKTRYPHLKINLAVGGGSEAEAFHQLALTPQGRRKFCKSLVGLLTKYNFDGVDVDWESPGDYADSSGSEAFASADRENFTTLLAEIRLYLDKLQKVTGKRYQLSSAGGPGRSYLANIEGERVAAIVDQANIMTYDFHGGWDYQTAHHTNLDGKDGTPSGIINVKLAVQNYLNAGFAPDQLVIGIALYGRSWKKVYADDAGLYQMSKTEGGAEYTYDGLKKNYFGKNGFKRIWDNEASAAYLWNGSEFITYDDTQSVADKARYVVSSNLRGLMLWEYSQNIDGELLNALY
ncbi:MAG: glycoside hydrolase family 18 protein [Bacillota bacterium]